MFSPQHSQKEIIKLKEGEEKQRRAREAREKAEAEKAARAARKRALVDMNAHETQEGVMDSLMEALQTGSAFSRPDQRRKRPTRVAGGKFNRTAYVWRQMAKKNQVGQRHIFDSNLYKSVKLKYERENLTPNGIAMRRDSLRNWMTELCAAENYYTPEDNQDLYKQMLIDEVKKTPKQIKHVSRITYFEKKRRCSNCNRTCYTALPINNYETPRRNVSVKTSGNLESRCVVVDNYSSPITGENVLLFNEARAISPVKQKRVIVSKIRKRNSIVRRAILNRKRIRAYNETAKRYKFCSLQSPSSMSATLPPVVNWPVLDTNFLKVTRSKSADSLQPKVLKGATTPIKLLRSKNYENLMWCKDENQNICNSKNRSLSSSSTLSEMSGVKLLSESSLLHVTKLKHFTCTATKDPSVTSAGPSRTVTNTYEPSVLRANDSSVKNNYNKLKTLNHKSWKRSWRFWRKSRIVV